MLFRIPPKDTDKYKLVTYLNGAEMESIGFENEKEMQKLYRQRIEEGYAVRVWIDGKKLTFSEAESLYREKGKKWLVRGERRC